MQMTDETLMALADQELPADLAREVQAAVDADPALQARLRLFVETRRLLQDGAAAPADTDRDAALIAKIRQASSVMPSPPRAANINRRPLAALAASLAVAVIGAGWWWQAGGPRLDLPASHLPALASLPSGETGDLPGGESITLIASYDAPGGELCREYETRAGASLTVRIACRHDGDWQLRFAERITASEGYVPASGEIAALDAFLADQDFGAPLSPDEERNSLE